MKYSIFFICLFCCSIVNAQTTTYEIDYSYDLGLGASCNVFSAEKTINGFKHQTTKGFPNYIVNTQIGSHINLACKRNSSSSQSGTDYQILFPFKKNYKYQINVYYKSTYASGEFSPMIGVRMNATKKTHNTSVSCSGPQSIDFMEYEGQGSAGLSFAWPTTPLISTGVLTQDYESLSIASFPLSAYQATQVQGIQVRTVRIVEIAPPPTGITPPTSGFEGKFYQNVNDGKKYVGMRGFYRELNSNVLNSLIDVNNAQFISINSSPATSLTGLPFISPQFMVPAEGDDPFQLYYVYINDQTTNKWYLGECHRDNIYAPPYAGEVDILCTELTDTTYLNYHIKPPTISNLVPYFTSSEAYISSYDGRFYVNDINSNPTLYIWGSLTKANIIKLPNLTGQ
jgi:hypothetical protein